MNGVPKLSQGPVRAGALLIGIVACLPAQTQEARAAYEAASIKPAAPDAEGAGAHESKGQVLFDNMPLTRLIAQAYGVNVVQVIGPDWMAATCFDIAAKFPSGEANGDHRLMLRTLLEDRFKLAVHREPRELPGYALVVAKSGFKLKSAEPGDHSTSHEGGRIETLSAKKTSMPFLAGLVSRYLGQMVVDKTGLDGVYDFDLRWSNQDRRPNREEPRLSEPVPTLPDALQETLGLRLQPQKVIVDTIVVDHLERLPTEN